MTNTPLGLQIDRLKVLLIDDDEDDFVITRDLLAEIGGLEFALDWVSTFEAARKAILRQEHDVYLVDHRLTEGSGLDLLREAVQNDCRAPIIMLTGMGDHEVDMEAMKCGAADFLVKGQFTATLLERAIRYAIKHTQAIENLRQSEQRYRLLIEISPDAISYMGLDGEVLFCNHQTAVMQGYADARQLMGVNVFACLVPEDRPRAAADLRTVLETGALKNAEYTLLRTDGLRLPIEICAVLVKTAENKPHAILAIIRDITQRKQAEEAIEKLAAFPRLNPNPILAIAADATLLYFNQAARDLARSLGDEHPASILPPNIRALVQECLAKSRKIVHQDTAAKDRTLRWSLFPVLTDNTVHCYAEDITDNLSLEAQLRQSQKMESIGQLAAGVAHDFNNLLTIIQGQICMLLSEAILDEKTNAPLQQISSAANRAANLTRQLLAFSRTQVLKPVPLDINEVVNNVAKLLTRILGEDIDLQLHYSPQAPAILADAGMIEQMIMNLAVNARDAMPNGGKLIITTSTADVDDDYAHHNPEARAGQYVLITVTDTGCGIDPAILPRIFEPFFTTKEEGKGTGLGLATVYGIIKQHQGWIELVSEVGRGSAFKVFLPSSLKTVEHAALELPQSPVLGGTETILVAEDEPVLRLLIREVLEYFGYRVLEAASGVEALAIWRQHGNGIDLLLADIVMPMGMSGHQLAKELLAQKSNLKVIYTTGYNLASSHQDLHLREGFNFLQKPFHPRLLASTVRSCLDHSGPPPD